MSTFNYAQHDPGDIRAASTVNTTFSNLDTASGALDATNLREEGLDEGCFVDDLATGFDTVESGDGTTALTNTSFALLTVNSVDMYLDLAATPINANEVYEIEAGLFFETVITGPSPGIPANRIGQYKLVGRTGGTPGAGGTAVDLTGATGRCGSTADVHHSGSLVAVLVGAQTYDYIELHTAIGGGAGTYNVNFAAIYGTRYLRAGA